jgi:hypothetical protein
VQLERGKIRGDVQIAHGHDVEEVRAPVAADTRSVELWMPRIATSASAATAINKKNRSKDQPDLDADFQILEEHSPSRFRGPLVIVGPGETV